MTATTPTAYTTNGWQTIATGADEFEIVPSIDVQYSYGASAPGSTDPRWYPIIAANTKHVANLPSSRSIFVRPLNSLPANGAYSVAVTSSAM